MAVRVAGSGSAVGAAPGGPPSSAVPVMVVQVMVVQVIVVQASVAWLSRRIATARRERQDSAARRRGLTDDRPDLIERYDQDRRRLWAGAPDRRDQPGHHPTPGGRADAGRRRGSVPARRRRLRHSLGGSSRPPG